MFQKLVSVIIPAYNAEHSLGRAVKSAMRQTWQNLEILIVNDGSSDGTLALAKELAGEDKRIRVLDQENGGVSRARNRGLLEAAGGDITFLDADDALAPEMITSLEEVKTAQQADIAGCGFSGEENSGSGSGRILLHTGSGIIREGILKSDTRVWSKLFDRRCLSGASFREGLTIGEDMLFLLDVIRPDTRYAALDRALYVYTENPEGAMEKPFVPSYLDQITCWDEAEKKIGEKFPDLLRDAEAAGRLAAIQAVSAMLTAAKMAKLSPKERQIYADRIQSIRDYVRERWERKDARAFLPPGYAAKIRLFLASPGLYFGLMSRR